MRVNVLLNIINSICAWFKSSHSLDARIMNIWLIDYLLEIFM